jgi:cysteine sulfinate desulfinase/cysteine desulfurase-like protein
VRFSLGAGNSMGQVEEFLRTLAATVARLKRLTAMAV